MRRPIEDLEAWASSLSRKDKRAYVKVCLDEFNATMANVRRLGAGISPSTLRTARSWAERQKRMLRALGHTRKMPVVRAAQPSQPKGGKNAGGEGD